MQNLLSVRLLTTNTDVKIYSTRIVSVVKVDCETWSVVLRKGHRVTAFVNVMMRKVFRPENDVAIGELRKLHEE